MKKIVLLMTAALLAGGAAQAAFEDWQVGIRAAGMSGAYVGVAEGVEAVRWNPAGLASVTGWQSAVYAKRLWGISGLTNQTLSLAAGLGRWGGGALSVQQVGCELETDQAVTLSHGFDLNRQLSFGYNLNFYRLWQQGMGSAITLGADIGLLARIYRSWRMGCFGHNLNHPSLGLDQAYDLPSGVGIGLSHSPFSGVLASVEATKDAGRATRYRIGSEFDLMADRLTLRSGIQTEGQLTLYSAGLEVRARGISVGYAFEGGHQALSGTHQFGLGYGW